VPFSEQIILAKTFAACRLQFKKKPYQTASQLAAYIFDSTLNVKQMIGFRGVYRVVIVRNYRMIFLFDDENLYLLRIGHRREIYQNLEM
jgi:mRNA-degrading endonuclease RelE of RelBE toxin-antitoxin system